MKKLAGVLLALALAGPAAAQDANAEFFARNAQAPGVKTIPGIQYKVLKSGPETGVHPKRSSTIKVRYEGKFLDGRVFDSSKNDPDGAVTFPLGKLIPGWVKGLKGKTVGSRVLLVLPPEDGYPEGSNNPPVEKGDTVVYVVDRLCAYSS